jgi:hypothetical protein
MDVYFALTSFELVLHPNDTGAQGHRGTGARSASKSLSLLDSIGSEEDSCPVSLHTRSFVSYITNSMGKRPSREAISQEIPRHVLNHIITFEKK